MKIIALTMSILLLCACNGTRPENLGVNNDKLAPCPSSPNCVSSYEQTDDTQHYIAPINYADQKTINQLIIKAINTNKQATIIHSTPTYIYAEFESRLMKFVDDVEFYIVPKQNHVHVRSASRIGYGDMNVNRERIEALRTQIQSPPSLN